MMFPTDYPDRIWFSPPKFWAATKDMSREETAELMERVMELADTNNLRELSQFDFVSFGNPWRKLH